MAEALTQARRGPQAGAAADSAPVLPAGHPPTPARRLLAARSTVSLRRPRVLRPPRGPERDRPPPCSRRRLLPRGRLAPHCWRRRADASRRARPGGGPRVRGERTGRPRPSSPLPRRRVGGEGRRSARRPPAASWPSRSGPAASRCSILCLCRCAVASWKAALTALCIPRAQFPGLSCPRLRQVLAWRLPPAPFTLSQGGLGCGHVRNKSLDFGIRNRVQSRCAGPASVSGTCSAFEAHSFLACDENNL